MPGLEEHLGGAGRGVQAVTSGCLCQVLLPGGFTSVWWLGFAHCIAIVFLSRRAPVGRKKPPTPNQPMAGCCQLSPLALRSALPCPACSLVLCITLSVPPGFGSAAGAACHKSAPKLSPGSWWCRNSRRVMGWRGQSRALPVPLLRVARSVGTLALGQERASHLSSSSCRVNKSLHGNYFCQEPNISLERGK